MLLLLFLVVGASSAVILPSIQRPNYFFAVRSITVFKGNDIVDELTFPEDIGSSKTPNNETYVFWNSSPFGDWKIQFDHFPTGGKKPLNYEVYTIPNNTVSFTLKMKLPTTETYDRVQVQSFMYFDINTPNIKLYENSTNQFSVKLGKTTLVAWNSANGIIDWQNEEVRPFTTQWKWENNGTAIFMEQSFPYDKSYDVIFWISETTVVPGLLDNISANSITWAILIVVFLSISWFLVCCFVCMCKKRKRTASFIQMDTTEDVENQARDPSGNINLNKIE